MSDRLIWFFKVGSFSHINAEAEAQLKRCFPEAEVRTVDVLEDLFERQLPSRAAAFVHAGWNYRRRILETRQNPRDFFTRLPWVWKAVKRLASRQAGDARTWFTFQTQSLFDAGSEGTPHFVYTDHTYLANRRYKAASRQLPVSGEWMSLEADLYRNASCTFTTSSFCNQSLLEDYGVSSIQCVYSGSNVRPPDHARTDRRADVILFVGVEWERKGGPGLVEAFKQVRRRFEGAELWIAGCNPGVDLPGVRELGKVSLDKVRDLYEKAGVFCLPSLREPSATVLMEAAAFALPVVATDAGGTPDRVVDGETGWLVPVGDVPALAAALEQVLGNPEEAALRGRRGLARYKEHFTWDAVGHKMATQIRTHVK